MTTLENLKQQFRFLKKKYGFTLSKESQEDWGVQMDYVNKGIGVGVKIAYEIREGYIFILLCRLVEGRIVDDPRNINEKTILNNFSLDDLISLKEPSDNINAAYEYPDDHKYHDEDDGLRLYARDFAANLEKHANDILNGDFGIWPQLDKIVRDRAREYGQYGKDTAHD